MTKRVYVHEKRETMLRYSNKNIYSEYGENDGNWDVLGVCVVLW